MKAGGIPCLNFQHNVCITKNAHSSFIMHNMPLFIRLVVLGVGTAPHYSSLTLSFGGKWGSIESLFIIKRSAEKFAGNPEEKTIQTKQYGVIITITNNNKTIWNVCKCKLAHCAGNCCYNTNR